MMHKLLRAGILVTFGMLIICIIGGCVDDDPTEEVTDPPQSEDDVGPPPATEVVVDPPVGSLVQKGGEEFTLKFDQDVLAASINRTSATGSGVFWKVWVSNLPYGSVPLTVEWTNQDGSVGTIEVGPYNVADIDFDDPAITSGTVTDGSNDIDPALINAGGFRFDFNYQVTGTIALTDEAGANLNWIANVVGQTATLTAVAGQELVNETTYKVEINVQDGAGNQLQTTITFVTQPK